MTINKQSKIDYQDNNILGIDLLFILARQIKFIIVIPSIFCIISIFYLTFFSSPTFESISKISSSNNKTSGFSQVSGLAAQLGISFSRNDSEINWVYEDIIKSRTIARAVLKRKFNTKKFGPQKTLLQILTYGDGQPSHSSETLEIYGVDTFLSMVDVYNDASSGIHTLKINSFEPSLSLMVNKALIEELDNHQRNYNQTKTSETRKFIEERIIDTQKELTIAEENLKQFLGSNRRIENSPALKLEEQRLTREVTVLTQVFITLKQQLETTKIEDMRESDYVIVIDPPELPLKKSKPNKRLTVIISGFMGIMLGLIIGFVREKLNDNNLNAKIKDLNFILLKNLKELFYIR